MSHPSTRLLYWSPRVLSIAVAVFLSLFALDVFTEAHGFWGTAVALLMHLIPTLIVVVALILAWRWERVGAAVFGLLAASYAWSVLPRHVTWALAIGGPLLLIAILFLIDWNNRPQLTSAGSPTH